VIAACSHFVLVSDDVDRICAFVRDFFEIQPHYANSQFADFVLPSGFRIAFFTPVGAAAKYFSTSGTRHFASIGVTTPDIDKLYAKTQDPSFQALGIQVSGPPKDHPWGEKSFLLLDPDGNRWEIAQSPSANGMLVPRD
jgi:catechol 2,3-dioxygenase-like lactoylglutathione lyase family enzyme